MVVIAAFLVVGFAAERSGAGVGSGENALLDRVILDWLLPVAIAYNVAPIHWAWHLGVVVALCFAITVIDMGLVVLACHVWHASDAVKRTLLVVVPVGNTAFFGFAAVVAVLGAKSLPDAIIFDQLGTTLMLVIYSNAMAGYWGTPVTRGSRTVLLRFRPLWGLALGTTVGALGGGFGWEPAHVVGAAATAALLPVAMIALGAKVASRGVTLTRHVAIGIAIRVIVGPAVLACAVLLLTGSLTPVSAATLQTAMPPAFSAALLAERRGLDGKLAYSLCGVGLVAACILLPLYGLLLG